MRWIGLAMIAIGCAHGYNADVTPIGDGRYMVRSAPDEEHASDGIAMQYAHRRASEVCSNGYDVIENKVGVASTTERVAIFGRRTNETPEVMLIVRCR